MAEAFNASPYGQSNAQEAARHSKVSVREFSLGYCPDVEPYLVGFGGTQDCSNLLVRGGRLMWDAGWTKLLVSETGRSDGVSNFGPYLFPIGDGGNALADASNVIAGGGPAVTGMTIDVGQNSVTFGAIGFVSKTLIGMAIVLDPTGVNERFIINSRS